MQDPCPMRCSKSIWVINPDFSPVVIEMKFSRIRFILSVLLVISGLLQMIGYVFNLPDVRGIGFLTVASPLPLVFSHFRGYETFALDFDVEVVPEKGDLIRKQITPALYSNLQGPYSRRNVYGAVFAYGPGFAENKEIMMRDSVLRYGFCSPGVLLDEFNLPDPVQSMTAHVKSRTGGDSRIWTFSIDCRK